MRSAPSSKLFVSLLLVTLTLAVYYPASRHGFVNYDDDRYVTSNPQVRAGFCWTTVTWAFTTFEQANWHPLTWLSHALDCQLFQLNPKAHHLTSMLLHALNVLLLFLILRWFTGYTGRSAMVAALFSVHPLNVESVAWIAERKTLLSMMFFLLAVAAYGWYVKKPAIGRYLAIMVLFACGLMCKPMVITLPFGLLLLDYWPLGRLQFARDSECGTAGPVERFASSTESLGRLCLEKVPLLVLSAASAVMTMMVQRGGGAVISMHRASPFLRVGNAIVSYAAYLKNMLWPARLALIYPYPHSLPLWQIAAAGTFLIAVTCIAVWYRKFRYLPAGWFWFLGTMVPMIGLVQVGNQAMADRYAYLPLVGVLIMIVWAAATWTANKKIDAKYPLLVGGAALLALCWATRVQLRYWQSDFTLWTHALAVSPDNFVAENNLGFALIGQGQRDQAIAHFRTAAALEPGDPTSQFNLGIYAQEQGDLPQATAQYEEVLRLTSDAQLRASAYANLGTVYYQFHDYERAKQCFDAVLKLNRAFPPVLQDLGLIAQKQGDSKETIRYFSWLTTVDPNDVHYFLLAQAFHQAGRDADAVWAYQQAVRLSRDISQTKQAALQLEAQ